MGIPMRSMASPLVLALALDLGGSIAYGEDWNQWRGARRDGVAATFSVDSWPPELDQDWTVEVGGGISGPVVDGDTVFVHSRQGSRDSVSALSLESGELRWNDTFAARFEQRYDARSFGHGPYATPAVADGTLFTYGARGVLTAYDTASGKRRWQVDFSRRYARAGVDYGMTASPVVVDGKCIVQAGGVGEGGVVAVDVLTGKLVWSWEGDGPGYSSPVVATLDTVKQIITQTEVNIVGLDADSGQLLWKVPYRAGDRNNIVTPVVIDDKVILTGYQMGTEARRIVRRSQQWKAERVWHTREVWSFLSSPVAVGHWLYGYSDTKRGRLYTLDTRTGELVWTSPGRLADNASLVATASGILVLDDEGTLSVYQQVGPKLQKITSYVVAQGETWAHPAVSSMSVRRLIIKDTDSVAVWRVPPAGRSAP